ncbi:MAG: hypothetical protein DMG24_11695 [Acidobacteria bacterium]|nr:MAG: hypothetical protein DMG24_11695 [Acidobacteriota bacterium]
MTEHELGTSLEAAEKNPELVSAAVAGLDAAALGWKPAPDKWSILEVLAHLADVEIVYGYRMRQVMADKEPVFVPIDQEDWARHLGYQHAPAAESLALYRANRRGNLRLLKGVTVDQLARGGFHPELKRTVTLAEWIERMANHGSSHLGQIERLKQAYRAQA